MSPAVVGSALQRFVRTRARGLCEYCLIHEDDTFFGCEVDHIVSRKHGGETQPEPTLFTSLLLRGRNYLDLLRYPAPPLLNVR